MKKTERVSVKVKRGEETQHCLVAVWDLFFLPSVAIAKRDRKNREYDQPGALPYPTHKKKGKKRVNTGLSFSSTWHFPPSPRSLLSLSLACSIFSFSFSFHFPPTFPVPSTQTKLLPKHCIVQIQTLISFSFKAIEVAARHKG